MSRVRVKICGIKSPEDGLVAAHAGADAIGLNFFPPSPRYVEPERARDIAQALPAYVNRVALFVNEPTETVERVLARVPVDTLQFHGDETPEFCSQFGMPYVKSVGVRARRDIELAAEQYVDATALLLDQFDRERWGGTGELFDWTLIPGERRMPIVLAGGLTADNVAEALRVVRPYAVDVSGGVESERGVKDPAKIEQFLRGVMSV
tara:strand:- start:591 stop:1211 length:621 start_codon:yes stop_codon:yes gene_type:complete